MIEKEEEQTFSDRYPIFTFTVLNSLHKKYNYALLFAMFLPSLLMIILLAFTTRSFSSGGYWLWYYRIYFGLGLFFLTSLVSLIIGTGIFRDEIADETIVFIMTKPIKRQRIYIEKLIAFYLIAIVVVTPGIIIGHITGDLATRLYDTKFSLSFQNSLFNLLIELLGAYILVIGLGSVFVSTGLWLRRPMLINLLLAFGIILEQFFLDLISNKFEPVYIAQNLVARSVQGFDNIPSLVVGREEFEIELQTYYLPNQVSASEGVLNFVIILILTIFMGLRVSRNKQFN
ncbi:MAG: ABC transporter permease [Candidatus Kariarchaeaceae archaeon]